MRCSRPYRFLACLLLSAWLLPSPPAPAQEVVFYRCTDAQGHVSMQNGTPCGPGMKQEIRRIGEVRTVPAPPAANKPAKPPEETPQYGEFVLVSGPAMQRQPAAEAAGLPAPPPLFLCRTWDGKDYLGDTATPEPRCVPMQVVGVSGAPALGMAAACEVKHDSCTAVPDTQLCAAWYRRLDEAEFRLRYADNALRAERQQTFDDIAARIKASNCATTAPAADAADAADD